jgi:light-regulated signal transduction histidine kinase (bacteriophytochrome)
MVHPDDLQSLMEIWNTSLQTGNTYRVEARLRNNKGLYHWHVVQGEPMRDEDGQVKKWIGAFTNIHGQKTMNQQLEQLVTQRTQELQRSNEDLQQFAHVASHDLKEPVRKIRTFNNRLNVEFSSQLPERACFYIDKVEAAATRMHAMIDGVLEYSTVSTTEHLLEMVNLRETIRQIELDLELVIQQKGALIFCDTLPVVEGFSVLLYQLLYNLMNNALKFTRNGVAPLLHINAKLFSGADTAQEWQLNPAVEYVQVTLQDNGIGFSQIQAEKIFKTFTRLNAKEKYEGTGLGLALCKKIVERHHGVISAAGMEGMGAIFKVVLPMRQPKSDV